MAKLSKAERDAVAFLKSFDVPALPEPVKKTAKKKPVPPPPVAEKPLATAKKRLAEKTDGRKTRKQAKRTPEQKREQTKAARAKVIAARGVTVTLKAPHWINGIAYGPGTVHGVDPEIAKGLLEDERRVEYNNQRFDGSQAAFIGPTNNGRPGFTVRQVPMQLFDSPMLNVLEAFTLQ